MQVATPVEVPGLLASQVSAGDGSTCALTLTGTVECWGDNNYGELGNGATIGVSNGNSSTAVNVVGIP